jgi:anti-sigma factor RsiW
MDCAGIDLIAYHIDAASPEDRERAERHLVACKACLEDYLALKRSTGSLTSRPEAERPGPEVRARLRRDVEHAFGPRRPSRIVGWLARPVPLYQSFAAAAVVLVAFALANAALRMTSPLPRGGAYPGIDTARPTAESLSIY